MIPQVKCGGDEFFKSNTKGDWFGKVQQNFLQECTKNVRHLII